MKTAKTFATQLNDRLCLARMFDNEVWFMADQDQGRIQICEPEQAAAPFPSDECLYLPVGCSHQDALDLLRQEKRMLLTVGQARQLFGVRLAALKRAK